MNFSMALPTTLRPIQTLSYFRPEEVLYTQWDLLMILKPSEPSCILKADICSIQLGRYLPTR